MSGPKSILGIKVIRRQDDFSKYKLMTVWIESFGWNLFIDDVVDGFWMDAQITLSPCFTFSLKCKPT